MGPGLWETLYWLAAAAVAYPYAIYPALLAARARTKPRPVRRAEPGAARTTVSVVIAAHNEAENIARRVVELAAQVAAIGNAAEIVVVSDGSTDRTAEAAREAATATAGVPVVVIDLARNVGKSAALNEGCRAARYAVVVFADARQTWAADALARLLENFADPDVGAVSGELFIASPPGVLAGVGLYWRDEKGLRRLDSLVHSTVGLTGSIAAVRRELFRPIPPGVVLDDVYWPLRVVMEGRRVVFDGRAHAFDRLPDAVRSEFRRKVRTLAGVFQLVAHLPEALLPWRNPVWFAWLSHKLMRLVVPWAWIASMVLAAALGGRIYLGLLSVQLGGTLLGVLGLNPTIARRSRLASSAGTFVMLNAAAFVAFWVWATGRTARSWTKTRYQNETNPTTANRRAEALP